VGYKTQLIDGKEMFVILCGINILGLCLAHLIKENGPVAAEILYKTNNVSDKAGN